MKTNDTLSSRNHRQFFLEHKRRDFLPSLPSPWDFLGSREKSGYTTRNKFHTPAWRIVARYFNPIRYFFKDRAKKSFFSSLLLLPRLKLNLESQTITWDATSINFSDTSADLRLAVKNHLVSNPVSKSRDWNSLQQMKLSNDKNLLAYPLSISKPRRCISFYSSGDDWSSTWQRRNVFLCKVPTPIPGKRQRWKYVGVVARLIIAFRMQVQPRHEDVRPYPRWYNLLTFVRECVLRYAFVHSNVATIFQSSR